MALFFLSFRRTKDILLCVLISKNFEIRKTALLFWHTRMVVPIFIILEMLWAVTSYDRSLGMGNENWVVNAATELFWKYRAFDGLLLISQRCKHMERIVGLTAFLLWKSHQGNTFFKQAPFFGFVLFSFVSSFLYNFVFVAFGFLSWITELFVSSAP